MPTLVITGHPSAGKSTFARILAERALAHPPAAAGVTTATASPISTVVIISEETACPGKTKTECYATSKAEKVTREALKSTFDKYCTSSGGGGGTAGGGAAGGGGSGIVLHRSADGDAPTHNSSSSNSSNESRLVILDSLNYIKGFRYEIHCIAKASGQRHGVVWVLNDPERCLEWNGQRRMRRTNQTDIDDEKHGQGHTTEEGWYQDDELIRELMCRYEPPDERNRWDKPLYRADVGSILSNNEGASANDNNDEGPNTAATANHDDGAQTAASSNRGDDDAKTKSSSADAVLSRTLYDMHCLTEAIGGDATAAATATQKTTITKTQKSASKSFKRSAAAGFKRNKSRSVPAVAAKGRSSAASEGLAISQLTPEALESLDASNSRDTDTSSINGQGTADGPNEETNRNPKKGGSDDKDLNDGTAPTKPRTLEELADLILNSFLGKDVTPLKEGKSTALHVNAGANVLNDVDAITQRVVTVLMTEQRTAAARGGAGTSGGKLRVPLGNGESQATVTIRTNRAVSLSELKRLRREYVKWSSSHPPEDTSEVGIAASFLTYLESQI